MDPQLHFIKNGLLGPHILSLIQCPFSSKNIICVMFDYKLDFFSVPPDSLETDVVVWKVGSSMFELSFDETQSLLLAN